MTEPYYQDDLVTLYLGDCREVTEWTEADVLVTDPPYGMLYQRNYTTKTRAAQRDRDRLNVEGDADTTSRDAMLARWGAEKPALVFGTWRVARPELTRTLLVWDKGNAPGPGSMYLPWGSSHEEIYVLGSAWPLVRGGGDLKAGGKPARFPSVVRAQTLVPGSHGRPDHPTPKPVPLMEALIEKCPPGVVADPYVGSGATLIAARNLGRRVVGVEIEERYCEMTARRLAQQTLFEGALS